MTNRLTRLAYIFAVLLFMAIGCSRPAASAPGAAQGAAPNKLTGAPSAAPRFQLPTSYPPSTCVDTEWVAGTDETHWVRLANCASWVGLSPSPRVMLPLHESLFIEGKNQGSSKVVLSATPIGIVAISGLQISPIKEGTALITIDGALCNPVRERSSNSAYAVHQPASCNLVTVVVIK